MSKSNTLTHVNSNNNENELKHKQFSSLEELNKFMDNLFRLLHIIKGFENIQYIIYGGVIRDILLGESHNDIDIALFYPKNFNKEFRSDELDSRLVTISDFTKMFFDFKIDIDRKKLDYSLLKINVNLPNNLYIHVDITSYNIHVEVGGNIYKHEHQMIELTYDIITPFLREVKLKEIGL